MRRTLNELVEPVVTGLGYEMVGLEHRAGGRGALLRVYIDHVNGITVEDCEQVSRQLSAVLDVEDPVASDYVLEVSSPGLERPLFTAAHFQRFVGHRARVRMKRKVNGQRKFRGVIREVRDTTVILECDGEELALVLDDIDRAKLVPDYE